MVAKFSAVSYFQAHKKVWPHLHLYQPTPSQQKYVAISLENLCIKNYKLQKELLFSDLSVSSVYNNECHLIYYPALPSSHLSSFNFNSKKWLTCNFSLLHLYIIQYTGSENTQRHQVQVVNLI